MMAVLTGTLLATAAGLNAYVPLLAIGLLARFTNVIDLPDAWVWLMSNWALILVSVLFVIEVLVDKFPALDTVNDVIQTVIRPASGGMVFAAGAGSETVAVADPQVLTDMSAVWPIVVGIVIALVPHLVKALARPIINSLSGGIAAPVVSTAEDTGSIGLTILAVFAPLVGIVFLVFLIWVAFRYMRKARLSRKEPGPAAQR